MLINFKKQNVDKMLDELFSETTSKRIGIDLTFTAPKSRSISQNEDRIHASGVMGDFVNKNLFNKKKDVVCNPLAHIVVLNKKGE